MIRSTLLRKKFPRALFLALLAVSASAATRTTPPKPDGKGDRTRQMSPRPKYVGGLGTRAVVSGNGIDYHGGPVLLGTVNVYYIWYGNWSGDTAVPILTSLAQNIGGSPYFNINTTYFDGNNNFVSGVVNFAGSTT